VVHERSVGLGVRGVWVFLSADANAAIEANPQGHVYFSNRCACYTSLNQLDKALKVIEEREREIEGRDESSTCGGVGC
jgi:hypothetical protein